MQDQPKDQPVTDIHEPQYQETPMELTWEQFIYRTQLRVLDMVRQWAPDESTAEDWYSELTAAIVQAAAGPRNVQYPDRRNLSLADIAVPGEPDTYSLLRLLGRNGRDVHFKLNTQFGHVVPKLTHLVLSDGRKIEIAGEHDLAYVYQDNETPGLEEATLNRLYDEWLNT